VGGASRPPPRRQGDPDTIRGDPPMAARGRAGHRSLARGDVDGRGVPPIPPPSHNQEGT
jgi:hypothetical protein